MRLLDDQLLLSVSDLNAFLGCRHAIVLARRKLEGEDLAAGEASVTMRLVQRRGLEHEARFLQRLRDQGRNVVEIPDEAELMTRVAATERAMRAGADVIFQAALARGKWHGFADFLLRVEQPSALGGWCYEIADTKLASHAKASHAIQLGLYADLVEAIQGVPPPALRVMLGNAGELVLHPRDVVHYTRHATRRLEDFLDGKRQPTEPEPCCYCTVCDWGDRCEEEWEAQDHLSLVANIRKSQQRKLRAAGVETLTALAQSLPDLAVPGMAADSLTKLRAQASLQLQTRTTGAKAHELLQSDSTRGFARLPSPDAGDIYFDMEGDPLFPGDGLEYLFGAVAASAFVTFWAHDHAQEKGAFQAFIDWVVEHLRARPGAYIYHYNHYEPTALKRLAMRHGTREAELDRLLRERRFVDLYAVVREGLRIGEPGYSLKNVERFFREAREGDVGTAADSIVAYEEFCETGDDGILHSIASYNEIDCRSTAELHAWLLDLRPTVTSWFAPDRSEAEDDRAEAREAALEALRAQLLSGAGEAELPYRTLVAELCDFHRREQKPQWWAMFDRMERDEAELIEDAECLAGLVADGPCRKDKRSYVRDYRYPAQDTKLRKGDKPTVATTAKPAGEIVELDEATSRVILRRGTKSGELPDTLSLGPPKPLEDEVLRTAMRRFANSVCTRDGRFEAIEGILRRELPRIAGVPAGMPVLAEGEVPLAGAIRVVSALDRSHLFIQGPPGTGKTWTASRIAVAMMKQGKRIGVSSLSHKAINNLLQGIEAAAKEAGFSFAGVKKASTGKPELVFDSEHIVTVTANEAVTAEFNLVAGTVYLFARDEQEQQFDTLFIDEAGQVSLANLVAMGLSARNIVLIGDQQQLGQPVQGSHPGGTGVSALEHLLEGAATVSPERGILLDVSFRMHPSLCGWVSKTVYDGRLRAHEDAGRQGLVLSAPDHAALHAHGLRLHPVHHSGRSQSCPEEADEAARLWHALVGQRWVDREGQESTITPDDILVVAPFNVQVNLLRSRLPSGARIGTVDKFQGQEAPVVIVSMTTSSGDDLPRDIAFLFSRNRMNVAVSRAKCLAIVLASPRLLEIPCSAIKDLSLLSTFCSIAGLA